MVDDATGTYIVENKKCFEDLKQVASQLAGWLVLAAAGAEEATPDHPVLAAARAVYREASGLLRRACPQRRRREHHSHLVRAAASIGIALKEAGGGLNVDSILIPLR